jgi:hypothetical protein
MHRLAPESNPEGIAEFLPKHLRVVREAEAAFPQKKLSFPVNELPANVQKPDLENTASRIRQSRSFGTAPQPVPRSSLGHDGNGGFGSTFICHRLGRCRHPCGAQGVTRQDAAAN